MGFLSKLFNISNKINNNINVNNFNLDEYKDFNNKKIEEFTNKYNLETKEGIMSIPTFEASKYPDVNSVSVVYMPEQILNRKATEFKKENKYYLAIECLKKANEIMPYSPFSYNRDDYERLVDMMILSGDFESAKREHNKLNNLYGTRLMELKKLQKYCAEMGSESIESYQKRIIEPYIQESNDREQYYWLLENRKNLAPKSYGGYRNMKNKKTENYLKIVNELKKDGIEIETLKFWI